MSNPDFDPDPSKHFSKFVDQTEKNHIGQDIAENTSRYVPRSALEEYWTILRIANVLRASRPTIAADVYAIQQRYLQIFSILVHIHRVHYLDEFTSQSLDDPKLPLKQLPIEWPDDFLHKELFETFAPHQWAFCPLEFESHQLDNRDLPSNLILPIDRFEMISQGDVAMVQKFIINDACNHLGATV